MHPATTADATVSLVRFLTGNAGGRRGAPSARPVRIAPRREDVDMVGKIRLAATAALALWGALACNSKPSPKLQARIDSLQQAANERDRGGQEMALDARRISEISAGLSKGQVRGKVNVAGESPGQASRDSVVARVRYIAARLNANESQLRSS